MKKSVEAIKVVVRCRPLTANEIQSMHPILDVDEHRGEIIIHGGEGGRSQEGRNRVFTFDHVYGMMSEQQTVFQSLGKPIVDAVMEGFNGTIFAYGQTGTGKSYTMEGPRETTDESQGIVPRSARYIFDSITQQSGLNEYLVRASYLEIYNEEIRDLLSKDPHKRLNLKEDPNKGVYIPGLRQLVVKDIHELEKVLQIGKRNRSTGATKMNQESSRSHSILTIVVECQEAKQSTPNQIQSKLRMGKLNLVDLAGSERQSKTESTGSRLKEGIKINLSLTALGNVISSLVDKKQSHVPYRDSKLTRLLQDSLGGNAKTVMIANIGPAEHNLEETLSTLRYAQRAKSIQNKPKINEDPTDAMLRQYQDEIDRLKDLLKEKESGKEVKETVQVQAKQETKSKVQKLQEERDASLAEKQRYEEALKKQEQDLEEYNKKLEDEKIQQSELRKKILEMESKVLHGGVNLLEKVEELNQKTTETKTELKRQVEYGKEQDRKIEELLDLTEMANEKYSTLEEELEMKNKRLKSVLKKQKQKKEEIKEMKREFAAEQDVLFLEIERLRTDLNLKQIIIDSFIPQFYQEKILSHSHYNQHSEQWDIDYLDYAGNMVRRDVPGDDMLTGLEESQPDVYVDYEEDGGLVLQRF